MSFSYAGRHKTKREAKKEMLEVGVPQPVLDFVDVSVAKFHDDQLISVNVVGHLHNGEVGNYEVSTVKIEVKREEAQPEPAPEMETQAEINEA